MLKSLLKNLIFFSFRLQDTTKIISNNLSYLVLVCSFITYEICSETTCRQCCEVLKYFRWYQNYFLYTFVSDCLKMY